MQLRIAKASPAATPTPKPLPPTLTVIHRRAPSGGLTGEGRGFAGGQFIPTSVWEAEKARAVAGMAPMLDAFGNRLQFLRMLYKQNADLLKENTTKVALVPLSTIEAQMKQAIRESYTDAFRLGKRAAGDLTSATPDQAKQVMGIRRDEFRYLRNFLADMREDGGRMDYHARMDMYRAAAREIFWLGFVLGNRNTNRRISWTLGETEHCVDCLRLANKGVPYTVADFLADVVKKGYLPQSGSLACLGYRCGCSLTESFV